jgi:hypothetical protein
MSYSDTSLTAWQKSFVNLQLHSPKTAFHKDHSAAVVVKSSLCNHESSNVAKNVEWIKILYWCVDPFLLIKSTRSLHSPPCVL